jgi:hypothetical protein
MKEQTNNFLENQRLILEQRRQLSEERAAARANGTELTEGWHPDSLKGNQNVAKPFDANEVRIPLPERIKKAPLLTIAELRERATEAGNAIHYSVEQFEHDDAHRDAYYGDLKAVEETIARLERELAEARAEAEALKSRGTPKEAFLQSICRGELDVLGVAGAIIDRLLENASLASFKCGYEKLSPSTKADLFVQFADRLQVYRSGSTTRLGKQSSGGREVTAEQVQSRAHSLLAELSAFLDKELA